MKDISLDSTAKDSVLILGENENKDALINRVAQEMLGGRAVKSEDAAPESAAARIGIGLAKGVRYLPEGMWNSVKHNVENPTQLLATVGMSAGMAFALKTLLPNSGNVGKIAAGAMGLYFTYKAAQPFAEGIKMANRASTWGDLDLAGRHLGNVGGEFVVNSAIAYGGYKVGAFAADKFLAAPMSAGFVSGRDNFYNKVNDGASNLYDRAKMAGRSLTDSIGLTKSNPFDSHGHHQGVIPPYMLEELSKRDPRNGAYRHTMEQTTEMRKGRNQFVNQQGQEQVGKLEVYDAKGKEVLPGERARFEGDKPTGFADADNVYEYSKNIREFYQKEFGRGSIDGKGMPYKSTVNYGTNYENAFWNGEQMAYGRPGKDSPFKTFVLEDVTAHEITHGITQKEAATRYWGQAGALNEHYSDVFGELVQQRSRGVQAQKADWLVGDGIWKEGVNGKSLRDMRNPGQAYNDPAIGKDPQPPHMDQYVKTRGDNGGVHINSGIPNRAFSEFASEVGGKAWEAPAQIWWQARKAAGANPSFAQFAHHTIESATARGFSDLVPALTKAWNTVGITPSATALDVLTPGRGGWDISVPSKALTSLFGGWGDVKKAS